MARDRLAPDLAGAVESGRAQRRLVRHCLPRPGFVVAARDQGAVGRIALPGAHGRAARRVDDPADTRPTRRFEDVVGAHDVGLEDLVEDVARAGARGEVHDRFDAGERGRDRVEVGDVALVALHAGDRPTVEGGELVLALQVAPERAADEPAHAGHEHPARRHHGRRATRSRRERGC